MAREVVRPDLTWYTTISSERGVPPRCPFATVHRCPRFYVSLEFLGRYTGATKIDQTLNEELRAKWQRSDLWPVTMEQETWVYGPEDDGKGFTNFCPETLFNRFG